MNSFLKRLAPVWKPHAGQRAFLECKSKIRVLACGRRWGKTDACAAAIVGDLLQGKPTRHLILAPTLDQAKLLFDRVVAMLELVLQVAESSTPKPPPPFPNKLGGGSQASSREIEEGASGANAIKVKVTPYPKLTLGKHTVIARSGHVGRSLRGNEATHVIVDEAAYVPEELVTEVAMPMLATNHGRLTLISTPNGLNHFWKFFRMGEAGEHGVWSRTAPSWESPLVSQHFLDIQREIISQRAFEVEYEAKFVDWAGMVFDAESIDGCIVPRVEIQGGPISIGVDWGRYEDYTAVAVLEGDRTESRLLELTQFRRNKWPEMVTRVAEIIRRFPHAEVLCDGTGVGDVVADMLDMEMGKPVKVLKFTNESKQRLIEGLKTSMEGQRMQFAPDPELIRQLKHFESSVSSAGNTKLAARLGTHDDLVIALALACSTLPKGPAGPVLVGGSRVFSKPRLRFEDLCFSVIRTPKK